MNAKDEFLEHIKDNKILCVYLHNDKGFHEKVNKEWVLKKGFNQEEWNIFLDSIDFIYNDGYGAQELFGYIWYEDGAWSERGEYDGLEWWEHKKIPEIPECVRR